MLTNTLFSGLTKLVEATQVVVPLSESKQKSACLRCEQHEYTQTGPVRLHKLEFKEQMLKSLGDVELSGCIITIPILTQVKPGI